MLGKLTYCILVSTTLGYIYGIPIGLVDYDPGGINFGSTFSSYRCIDETGATCGTGAPSVSPSPTDSSIDKILLIAIVTICSTVIVVALCCGCICLIKMRYRFSALRMNFYTRNLFNRNNRSAATPDGIPGENDYKDAPEFRRKTQKEKDRWEINAKNLVVNENEKLGAGAFASVYKGYLKGRNPLLENAPNINFALEQQADNVENEVAVKMLHAHADDEARKDLMNEIDFMKTLGYHPHVLNLIGCVTTTYDPLLVVEYCAYGDLLRMLRQHKGDLIPNENIEKPVDKPEFVLSMKDLLSFAWQISDGLVYLSSRNFIHRDIAARNVLITRRMVAKISDFGLCRYSEVALYTTKGGKLPIKWMALEALKQAEFTSKTDVWAFAVLLYELFTMGDTPYHSIQPGEMADYLQAGNRLERPEFCPIELYTLMRECWSERPENRPTFEQIRQRIATFLDVSSDSYGYIQVSASEYQRIYVTVRPDRPIPDAPMVEDEHLMSINQYESSSHRSLVRVETSSISMASDDGKAEAIDEVSEEVDDV